MFPKDNPGREGGLVRGSHGRAAFGPGRHGPERQGELERTTERPTRGSSWVRISPIVKIFILEQKVEW